MKNLKSNPKPCLPAGRSEIRNQKYLICFDLDGTLMDSMAGGNIMFFDMVDKEFGIDTAKLRNDRRVWAIAAEERFDMFWKKEVKAKGIKKEEIKDFMKRFRKKKQKVNFPATRHAKGAVELIVRHFKNTACVSSNLKFMLNGSLKRLGLREYFKKIVGMDRVKHSKPNPEIYEKVIKLFGLPKKNCLTFEDSSVGIESAKRAGLKAIGVATGVESVSDLKKTKADIVLPNLSELKIQMLYDLLGI